jgi:hypothetical protein
MAVAGALAAIAVALAAAGAGVLLAPSPAFPSPPFSILFLVAFFNVYTLF